MMKSLLRCLSLLYRRPLAAAASVLMLAAPTSTLASPSLTNSANPISMKAGTLVINGAGFDSTPAHNTVQFNNGAVGTVTAATFTSLTVAITTAPTGTGSLTAVVSANGETSGAPVQIALVEPLVQFSTASGNVNATDGSFSIPVVLTGPPSFNNGSTPSISTFATGFSYPTAVAFDSAGNLYVGESGAGTVTQITPAGARSTFATGLVTIFGMAFDAGGNLFVSNQDSNGNGIVSKVTPAGAVSTFVSSLSSPRGLGFDSAGNLYVANSGDSTVSKITPTGEASVYASGFYNPSALTVDPSGNVYVANEGNGYIFKIAPSGAVSTIIRLNGYNFSLYTDGTGNLFVTLIYGSGGIYNPNPQSALGILMPNGALTTLISSFSPSSGLAMDASGNLFAGSTSYPSTSVSKISPTASIPFTLSGTAVAGVDYGGVTSSPVKVVNGQLTANITGTLTANPGLTPTLTATLGTPTGAYLQSPSATTLTMHEPQPSVTPSSSSLAMNAPSIVIQGVFSPVAANNTVTFNNGAAGTISSAAANSLTVTLTSPPTHLGSLTATVTTNGVSTGAPVQVASIVPGLTSTSSPIALNATTLVINGVGFDPIAANNTVVFSGGVVGRVTAATATQLTVTITTLPSSVGPINAVVTTDGVSSGSPINVGTAVSLVQFGAASESVNATAGNFSIPVTITGNPNFANGLSPFVTDLGEEFSRPKALALDAAHSLYVADDSGVVIKVVAGGAHSTFLTGFSTIGGLVCDAAGNLYVADRGANTVSKVTPAGVVSVFASGLNAPTKMVFDSAGNLYVANAGAGSISKVSAVGTVSTFASGFASPDGLTFDKAGNLYVANATTGTVSVVTPGGVASIFASGLNYPVGLGFDALGDLYVLYSTSSGVTSLAYDAVSTGLAAIPSVIIIINPDQPNGAIAKVSSSGVVSTFVSGLFNPTDLISDAAGNIYITSVSLGYNQYGGHNGMASEYSPSASVNFTLDGTAVNGVDYSDVYGNTGYQTNVLTFLAGQPTLYITGTLYPDAGSTRTLTLSLQTPSGAVLGTPATNTLTIVEPPPTVTTSTASLPMNAPTITITGFFSPVTANNTVTFNRGAVGTVTSATSTSLTVTFSTLPQSIGALSASVTSNGTSSGPAVTVATVVPAITASAAALSLSGTTLTISGLGFDPVASHNTVVLSNGLTGTVTAATATQLTVKLGHAPTSTGNIYVTVTTNGLTSVVPVSVGTVEPTVQFTASSETISATTGTFSIPVTITGDPTFDSGTPPAIATIASGYTLGYYLPSAIAFDHAGNLYLANSHDGVVTQFNPNGAVSIFASGFVYPVSIAFDSAGNLFLADQSTGNISKITPAGSISTYLSGYKYLNSLAFDAAGNLYVAYEDANFQGFIQKVTPAKVVTTFVSGFYSPNGLVFDAAGRLYFYDNGSMYRVTTAGAVSTFVPSLDSVGGVTIDAAGNLYASLYYDGQISKITPGGAVSTLISGISEPEGLAFDSAGYLFVVDHIGGTGSIHELFPTAIIPFTLSGTAVAGTDYSGITASPLVIVKGQTTANITGTLLPDPGVTPTLTMTFSAPQGAIVGTPATNTLTITEPPPHVTSSTASLAINVPTLVIQGLFNPVAANNTVTFNSGAAGTVTSASASSLTVTFTTQPKNLGSLTATVVSKGQSTGGALQVATVVPALTTSASAVSLAGNTLTITGFGFDSVAAHNIVTLSNDAVGTVTAATATQLTVTFTTLPSSTGNLTAVVTTNGFSSGAAIPIAVVEPVAQFITASESVNAVNGAFSIPVKLTGNPTFAAGVSPVNQTVALGISGLSIVLDASGNIYAITDINSGTISKLMPDGSASTLASGLASPSCLAMDSAGNVYVACNTYNYFNNTPGTVYQVTPGGTVSLFATGFANPTGMTFDTAGNLYVVSTAYFGDSFVGKVTPVGDVSIFATGIRNAGGLAIDAAGNLYVSGKNSSNQGIVSKVTPNGSVSVFAAGFSAPLGMAFDPAGNLYVSDGSIKLVTPAGGVSTFATNVYAPDGLMFDSAGNLYVANRDQNYRGIVSRLLATALVPFTVSGTAAAGVDYSGLTASPLTFVNGQPTVYITGTLIPHLNATPTLTVTLGTPSGAFLGSPAANTLTILEPPASLTSSTNPLPINATGIVLNGIFNPVAANNAVTFNDGAAGTVTGATATTLTVTFTSRPAGLGNLTATVTTAGTSTGAPVQVATVVPVAISTNSVVSINSTTLVINGFGFDPIAANNTVVFSNGAVGTVTVASSTQLTITLTTPLAGAGPLTAIVTTDGFTSGVPVQIGSVQPTVQFNVGSETVNATDGTFSVPVSITGTPTFLSGTSTAIQTIASNLNSISAMRCDAAGNLYIVGYSVTAVTKVTPAGVVSIFASVPTGSNGLAIDPSGNLYISNSLNNTLSKVTPTGSVSPFVSGIPNPAAMAFDATGNLYVAVNENNGGGWTIRKVTPAANVSHFAPNFSTPYQPSGLTFDTAGNLFCVTAPDTITKFTPAGVASTFNQGFGWAYLNDLAFDPAGNLFVSASYYSTLGFVTPDGTAHALNSSLFSTGAVVIDASGNLYVSSGSTISKVLPSVTVYYDTGGTAGSYHDYSLTSNSPLTFIAGQSTANITGTLSNHAGSAKTLLFALHMGSGALLGTPATNTLNIEFPVPVVTSAIANVANDSTYITINGSGFDSYYAGNNTVVLSNGAVGTVVSSSPTQLSIFLSPRPSSLGALTAVVTTNGRSSGAPVQIANVVPFGYPTGISLTGGTIILQFSAAPNTTYSLQYSPGLLPATWSTVTSVTSDSAGNLQYVGTQPGGGVGYYRLTH